MKKKINLRNKAHYLLAHIKKNIIKYDNNKVNFIIAGVQKGGTTALYNYLDAHKQIIFPSTKEIHFFDYEPNFLKRKPDYLLYRAFFPQKINNRVIGEATPIYLWWKNSLERIYNYNPDIKIIIILRNPINRAFSHWNMEYQRGEETFDFSTAIRSEESRSKDVLPYQHRNFSYISRGMYFNQLNNLFKIFEKSQILVLKNEELYNDPKKILNQICDFLKIEKFDNVEHRVYHKRSYKSKLDKDDKNFLINIFKRDIEKIEKMLNWKCEDWYK